ncbi:hypothetical protein AA957_18485 [Pseudomonas trivialis]|uniref:Uncharacterized protein n=1 Tax=Pseudomonas trivialis TaxID=200450 RepID=A0A0H5AUB7_9PSED|nr:hypothetical protein AA957_18485 [Pseudomonas trivialis]
MPRQVGAFVFDLGRLCFHTACFGLRFFCVFFRVTEVILSQASQLPHLTALMRMYSINVGAGLPAMADYLLVHGLS